MNKDKNENNENFTLFDKNRLFNTAEINYLCDILNSNFSDLTEQDKKDSENANIDQLFANLRLMLLDLKNKKEVVSVYASKILYGIKWWIEKEGASFIMEKLVNSIYKYDFLFVFVYIFSEYV